MACSKQHRYLPQWEDLSPAQDDTKKNRHKCAGCAYVEGLKDALNGNPEAQELSQNIPESQAGTVRHKDAYEAYKEGYNYGSDLMK